MSLFLRTIAVAVALGGLLLDASERPKSAHACSIVGFSEYMLPHIVDESAVIAVGHLREATRTDITLEVEEGLKGATQGQRLLLNNQQFGLDPACGVHVQPGSGWHLPEEARVIAFLKPDPSGPDRWMPAYFGDGVFELEADDVPFGAPWAVERVYRLDELRAALAARQGLESFDPGLESIPPCSRIPIEPATADGIARLSAAVALATVVEVQETRAVFRTDEVLWGAPGETFSLNRTGFHQTYTSCLEPSGLDNYEPGQQLLLLLRPDEFGVAQYRLANWGAGVARFDGEWLAGLPTLQDVRALLAASPLGQSPTAAAAQRDQQPAADDTPLQADRDQEPGDSSTTWLWASIAAVLLAGAAFGGLWRWKSR